MKMRLRPNNKKHISIEINGKLEKKNVKFSDWKDWSKDVKNYF
jgi:hypothetical protein